MDLQNGGQTQGSQTCAVGSVGLSRPQQECLDLWAVERCSGKPVWKTILGAVTGWTEINDVTRVDRVRGGRLF